MRMISNSPVRPWKPVPRQLSQPSPAATHTSPTHDSPLAQSMSSAQMEVPQSMAIGAVHAEHLAEIVSQLLSDRFEHLAGLLGLGGIGEWEGFKTT